MHALIGGGNWNNGVHCGSRAVNCNNYPWNVNTNIGVRCVCDLTLLQTQKPKRPLAKIYILSKSDGSPVPADAGQTKKANCLLVKIFENW